MNRMKVTIGSIGRLLVPALAGISATAWAQVASAQACASSVWGCLPFDGPADVRVEGPGSGQNVTVIGDSLIDEQDDDVALDLAGWGFRAHTYALGGTSYYHWNNRLPRPGGGTQTPHQDIGEILTSNASVHAVLALGANDIRRIQNNGATLQDFAGQLLWAMTRADDSSTGCVILVEPAGHSDAGYNAIAQQVRDGIVYLAAARNAQIGATHFVTLDWHAASQSHPEWFKTINGQPDIHHTDVGKQAYRDLITFYVAAARNGSFGC